ncbi:hypothetical protein N665_0420s0017 [Sinapis alba]|nr:hypothetical protein N665_0420s0017 [Sinapis alba]
MVDTNATMMQASIVARMLPQYRERLTAGTMISISGFDVSRCAQNFRLTDSSMLIKFNESTTFEEIADPVSPLPEEAFQFRNQAELIGLANTNTQLPDIIGEILSVKITVSDPPEDKNRVMVTMKLDSDETVTLSLFDSQLESMRIDPKVIVASSINPKMVGAPSCIFILNILLLFSGRLFLNETSGTHVYFDKKTRAGESRFYELVARDTGLPSAVPLLRSYAKVEKMSVAELNSFIVESASQEIDFLCTGRVVRVDAEKGWCYVACSQCSKKLQRTVSAFTCGRCNNSNVVGSLHYRVEMAISDDIAEGTFVWFDGVMTKLHGEDGDNPEDSVIPPFVAGMEGRTYTFQVRVNTYNFTEHHKTFTITRVAEDHGRLPVQDLGNNVSTDNDDNDDDDKLVVPPPDAIGGASSAGDTGPSGKARKITDGGPSKVMKKSRVD